MLFFRYTCWVALGGAFGAVLRFWLTALIHLFFERGFPWGTLSVNVIGSFLMGFFTAYLFQKFSFSTEMRSFLLVGLLGAFTTFSTFSLDVISLLQGGKLLLAMIYIFASFFLSLLAAFLGFFV